jgi:hypothetical protein
MDIIIGMVLVAAVIGFIGYQVGKRGKKSTGGGRDRDGGDLRRK